MKNKFKLNNFIEGLTICYLLLPVIIFFLGWLKFYLAVPLSLCVLYFGRQLYHQFIQKEEKIICRKNMKYWLIVICISAIWLYFSGIGGFSFQNDDFWARNPIFYDLIHKSWPVKYDLSNQTAYLSYYFTWWLPVSLLAKVFHFPMLASNILLYIYALLGILILIYHLNKYFRQCKYLIVLVLIFFSGLDIIPYLLQRLEFTPISHLEWWAYFFQYSANTTQLYWVFNQSLPIWIITIIFLLLPKNNLNFALLGLTFAYSPWATLGFIPIVIKTLFEKKKDNIMNFANIVLPLIFLIVYGSFYLASNGSYEVANVDVSKFLMLGQYLIFIFFEFGIYFLAMGREASNYRFYKIVLIELLLLPFTYILNQNLFLRGSIIPLFLLMIFVIQFLMTKKNLLKKKLLIVILVIGAITPLNEINRSVYKTFFTKENLIQDEIKSFDFSYLKDSPKRELIYNQFFTKEEKSPFFKYLFK